MDTFIGIGRNLNGPDLPLGLGMQLAQDPKAMDAFGRMSKAQRSGLISYIQGAKTGSEAQSRIAETVNKLSENQF